MTSMMEQLEKDEQQRKQDALDAARYRKLRHKMASYEVIVQVWPSFREIVDEIADPNELDEWVDAAISAEKKEGA